MNLPLKIDLSSSPTNTQEETELGSEINQITSKIINNIHRMPWLKQVTSSQNGNVQQSVGKDDKISSVKKTDEDYFPGTREEKRGKKKREKKGKSVVAISNLEDLVNLTQRTKKKTPVQDLNEISIYNPTNTEEEAELGSEINQTTSNNTVWSTTVSSANKLFPNVQSVTIDRSNEEEMLSRAIAESIATIQLEQFNKPSLVKEDRWETLYGDNNDEGSWDNIRRNLPSTPQTTNSKDDASGQGRNRDPNHNSSKTGGILRNTQQNLNRYSIKPKELDFCFKKPSEGSRDEVKTDQSAKLVSFNESIAVKVCSSESSESDECEKVLNGNTREPNIDKFGRVDGYSERRLFMGKGARMREITFLKNRCRLEVGDMPSQNFDSNSKATAITEIQRPGVPNSRFSENLQSQTPIPNPTEPKIEKEIAVRNFHPTPEIGCQKFKGNLSVKATIETEKPVITTLQCPNNIQSQKAIPNVKEPETKRAVAVNNFHRPLKTEHQKLKANSQATAIIETQGPVKTTSQSPKNVQPQSTNQPKPQSISTNVKNPEVKKTAIVAKNLHRTPETPKNTKHNTDNGEKFTESVVKSPIDKSSLESISMNQSSASGSTTIELESNASEKTELEPIKRTKNLGRPYDKAFNTSDGTRMKDQQINHYKNESVSPCTATIIFANEKPEDEINNPSQRVEVPTQKDVKDLVKNIMTQAMMSKDLAKVLRTVDNVSDEEPESESRCLVPTSVREDEYTPNFSTTNFQYTDSSEAMLNAEFQSPAHQNLLVAGVSNLDTSCNGQSLMTHDLDSQNLQYQRCAIPDSVPVNTIPLQSQTLNNLQYIQPACIRSGNQIYQGTPINQLPNLNSNAHSMLPNHRQVANKPWMDQTDYAYLMHHLDLQNLAYQSVGLFVNPDHCNVSSFMESKENVMSSESIEDLGPMTYNKHPSYKKTYNDGRQFSVQALPGLAKHVQLPPGFTKKESIKNNVVDTGNQVIHSSAEIKSAKDVKPKQGKFSKKRSELQSTTNNCREETSGNFVRRKTVRYERNSRPIIKQNNRAPLNNRQHYYRSHTCFECRETKHTDFRKVPYPILGATQSSHEKCSDSETDELKSSQCPKLHRDAIINQSSDSRSESVLSTPNDNTSEDSMGLRSSNNNYLTSSTLNATLDLDRQRMNNSNTVSWSALPGICQIPDHQSLGSSSMANWHYNVNFMNPTQVPINFVPSYQKPAQDQHNFIVNAPAVYYKTPMYPNMGFPQLPMHMLSPVQIPVYGIPHVFNTEGNDLQNVRPENIESPGIESMLNHDPSIKMQQSIIGAPSCFDYNLNQAPMGHFMSNSNFRQTGNIPNIQDSWNAHVNHTNSTMGQIFNNVETGRGRGRLVKKDLS